MRRAGQADPPARRSTLRVVLFVLGLLAAGSAVAASLAPAAVQRALARLFGPPQVALGESYARKPDGPTVDHAAFDALLKRFVDADGFVDYPGLAGERPALQADCPTRPSVGAAARPKQLTGPASAPPAVAYVPPVGVVIWKMLSASGNER